METNKQWLINEIEIMGSETSESYPHEQMVDREVVYDLIDQLDEPEKIVIPKFVADHIRFTEDDVSPRISMGEAHISKELNVWLAKTEDYMTYPNQEKFMRAWLDGYEIEKEPLYYAKIKGHELIDTEPILDDNTGKDVSEWNRNIYFIQQLNKKIVIDMKHSGLRGAKHFMTIKEWAELGINEDNAEFEPVEVAE